MSTWKTLLVVYDKIAVKYLDGNKETVSFEYAMTPQEVWDGVEAFDQFPHLVADLTSGAATIECDAILSTRPLTTLSQLREHQYWPSAHDTREEVGKAMSQRRFHSVLIYWPQNNFQAGTSVPSGGWGLGMGASSSSYNATYATVANAPSWAWQRPTVGEVWLHEWLHGVCAHFASRGRVMPKKNVDGADSHGYVRSPTTGWTDYYRDLMTCHVAEEGKLLGIPLDAWREHLA